MISDKHKCIFIHINKTGGTSISQALGGGGGNYVDYNCGKHAPAMRLRQRYPKKFENYFKFTFVRNPWDKILSQYFFRVVDEGRLRALGRSEVSFNEFVKKPFPGCHWVQLNRISDKNGKILVDFIGRFETLQDDFNVVCDKLGQKPKKLPHAFGTQHKPYWEYYDDESRELIAIKYKKDIEYFGYKFGE